MATPSKLVSTDSAGQNANGDSYAPSISADGRFVAFESDASSLNASDTNGARDVFVKDVLTGTTTLVSTDSTGEQANGWSYNAAFSGDGRFVAFQSDASNLVAGDSNGKLDVFVKDLLTGTTTLVSSASTGRQATGASYNPSVSGDGRFVTFQSGASNLVANDINGTVDIFVKDLLTGTTTRVSTNSAGWNANAASSSPSISADGRFVAFHSDASNLVSGDINGKGDVFVKNLLTGVTTRVSTNSAGWNANGSSSEASISADGRYVAFQSSASNLVANGWGGIFVKDLLTGTTTRVDNDVYWGFAPSISADGGAVAFSSYTGEGDVFVKDLATGTTTHVDHGVYWSSAPSISADGSVVAFHSFFGPMKSLPSHTSADGIVPAGGTHTRWMGNDVYIEGVATGVAQAGNDGADWLIGGERRDRLFGKGGNDSLLAGSSNDVLSGGDGDDDLDGGAGSDVAYGGNGDDAIDGGNGHDKLFGQAGDDLIRGGSGDDVLTGLDGADTLNGGDGHDSLEGGSGSDAIDGGAGNDRLLGGAGDDSLAGGGGDDRLHGEQGNDTITGGDGNDTMTGGEGDDIINGGDGNDRLSGGAGADKFVFALQVVAATNVDRMIDFTAGQDLIDLRAFGFADIAEVLALITTDGSHHVLNLGAAGGAEVVIENVSTLQADDFLI